MAEAPVKKARCYCSWCQYGRWQPKPPVGERCEASMGWKSGQFGEPLLMKCGAPATVTNMVSPTMHIGVYLCDEHQDVGVPNPKRRRKPAQPVPDGLEEEVEG